ncbi:MAG: hypothetical protein ACI9Y1_000884 [Lentisphaeria bacterium]|jgi:hypothetical protein
MNNDSPNTLINAEVLQKREGRFSRIDLFYIGKVYQLREKDLPFKIGRDNKYCNLTVSKDVVSRVHCIVDIKDNQIGILDRSTNGTVVKVGEANSVIIREEFYPLTGKGCLTLGEQFNSQESRVILFKVLMEAI